MRIQFHIAASVLAAAVLTSVSHASDAAPASNPAAAQVSAVPPVAPAAVAPALAPVPAAAPAPAAQPDAVAVLSAENAQLKEKLKALETCSITAADLSAKNVRRLKEIAVDIRAQRQGLTDFEGYVKWMSANVAGYSKYLSAGSVAAGFAKVLPIPYAGQASVFTKFVASAALSLSQASVSINKYLGTSQQFLLRTDKLDPARGASPQEVSDLVRFADQELLKGMLEVQERLNSTAELSASSLSYLESLNHYLGSTDEYWAKTKSLLKSGDEKKEKGFISESAAALKARAQAFNAKFRLFDDAIKKDGPLIKSLVTYDDLIRELRVRVADNRK